MTTTVTIDAHCNSDTEVTIHLRDVTNEENDKSSYLQDGQSQSFAVYDNLKLEVKETPIVKSEDSLV